MLFDGSTGFVSAPHAPELNTTGDWTVEAWFRDETPGGYNHPRTRILTKGDTTANPEVPYFISLDSNGLFAGVRTGGVSRILRFDLAGVSANTWHHMAATFIASSRVLTLYLDGVQVAQTTVSGFSTVGNTGPVDIGHNASDGNFWRGKLDDVRIWNVVRTAAQIQANFQMQFTLAPAGLVGNWRFDEGSGTTAADNTGTPQNGTLVGGVTWSTDVHP